MRGMVGRAAAAPGPDGSRWTNRLESGHAPSILPLRGPRPVRHRHRRTSWSAAPSSSRRIQGGRIASVALEKVQVAVLADRVAAILAELERRGVQGAAGIAPSGDDDRPLDEPLREEFRVGTLTISWDNEEAELLRRGPLAVGPRGRR